MFLCKSTPRVRYAPSKSHTANAHTVFVSAVARGLKTLKMLMNFWNEITPLPSSLNSSTILEAKGLHLNSSTLSISCRIVSAGEETSTFISKGRTWLPHLDTASIFLRTDVCM